MEPMSTHEHTYSCGQSAVRLQLFQNNWSSKTDAWSFAATVWELLHRCRITPFESLTNAQILDNAKRVLHNPASAVIQESEVCV